MTLHLVTAPAIQPVTAAQVWAQLRVPLLGSPAAPADATHIAALTAAAIAWLDGRDGVLGRALCTQTWDMKLDRFPVCDDAIRAPLPPLQSVTSIAYTDENGASQTLSTSLYRVLGAGGWDRARIVPAYGESWPTTRAQPETVTVRFVAGYGTPGASPDDTQAAVPEALRQALLLLVSHWYQNREPVAVGVSVAPMPLAVDALVGPYIVRS
jgi:uncharacterized phiE125 gp8 family phage protein